MGAMDCPHCGAYADMVPTAGLPPIHIPGLPGPIPHQVWGCRVCRRYIMGEGLPDDVPRNYVPVPGVVQSKAFDHVPENIRKDAEEAVRCYAVGAWRASAAMARRAIQATAYAKGAPKKRLIDQIDWLANEGLITTQMKDVAHHVRLGGNLGAHPDSDGIKDVEHADAERVLLFLEQFFTYVYTIPAQLDQVGGESS